MTESLPLYCAKCGRPLTVTYLSGPSPEMLPPMVSADAPSGQGTLENSWLCPYCGHEDIIPGLRGFVVRVSKR